VRAHFSLPRYSRDGTDGDPISKAGTSRSLMERRMRPMHSFPASQLTKKENAARSFRFLTVYSAGHGSTDLTVTYSPLRTGGSRLPSEITVFRPAESNCISTIIGDSCIFTNRPPGLRTGMHRESWDRLHSYHSWSAITVS